MTHACIKLDGGKAKKAKEDLKREEMGQEVGERNLDSGYAWLILAVMFLLGSSTGGTNRVYGLIYAKQVAIGYYDHEQASWPIATGSTVENLAGLMTPALAQFLTWRQMELLATLFFVVANVGAYFSDSLAMDILCLGIIQGLALSINTVLSLVINNDYFRRYRTTAYGISLSGSTFGIIYLGPLVSWCLEQEELEFRTGYLAIGGVLALNVILVIFIKPRDKAPSSSSSSASIEGQECKETRGCMERKRSLLERHLERKSSVASIALMCKQKRLSELQRRPTLSSPPIVPPTRGGGGGSGDLQWPPALKQQPEVVGQQQPAPTLKKSASSNEASLGGHTENNKGPRMSLFSAPPAQQQPPSRQDEIGGRLKEANMTMMMISDIHSNLSQSLVESPDRSSFSSEHHDRQQQQRRDDSEGFIEMKTGDIINRRVRDQPVDDCTTRASLDKGKSAWQDESGRGEATTNEQQQQHHDEGLSWQLVGALLRSPYLHCVWIMLSLYYLIARIFIIILVDLAKDNGLTSGESRALLNCWSVGEIVGRIVLCSFVDLEWLSCRACILLTCTSMSLCIGSMALLSGSFYLYAICSALVAALISLEYVLINVLMIEYLGQQRVTSCYSVGSFVSSLALLGRPALIGLFRDQLGSYNGLLLLLAALSLSFGLLFGLMEPLLVRYWPKRLLLHRSQLLSSDPN